MFVKIGKHWVRPRAVTRISPTNLPDQCVVHMADGKSFQHEESAEDTAIRITGS